MNYLDMISTRFLRTAVASFLLAVSAYGQADQQPAESKPAPPPEEVKPASPSSPPVVTTPSEQAAPAKTNTEKEATKVDEKPAEKPTSVLLPPPFVKPDSAEATETKEGEFTGRLVVIPIGEEDLINPARFEFMSRTLKRASEEGAEAVVFDMDTPGGIAWNTTTVMMEDLQKLQVRSFAYVNPRALSAGALIALGTDAIYMSPASSIGAATPVNSTGQELGEAERAKMNSAMMAMARSAAKAKGHRAGIADAMIDKDVGLKIGEEEVVPKGQILTLDQEQATKLYDGKPLLAKGVVKDLNELKKRENLRGEVYVAEPKGFELVAIWITQYAAILLLIGLAAGYIEMQSPGLGLPGVIAALAFGTFFFGHYIAGSLIGYETVVIFILGLALILVEFFILPGHIIPGLLGLLMVVGSLIYTMAGWDITVPEGEVFPVKLEDYAVALWNMALAFIGAVVVILLAMRFLPNTGPFSKFILETAVGGAQASIEGDAQRQTSAIAVGAIGITRSSLRPYGNVDFDGVHIEAMIEGDYLPPQSQVKVRSVQGGRVVVEKA